MLLLLHRQEGYVEHVSPSDGKHYTVWRLIRHRPALIVGNFLPITEATPGPTS
jgi:hypothetical protein